MDAATIANGKYAAYFEALIRRTRDERRFEVAATPRSRMKDAIMARLAVLSPERSVTATSAERPALTSTSINRVYIDVHSSDVDLATPLLRALRERELSVVLGGTVSTGTPASRLQSAEEAVSRSDLVILVFGTVAGEWAEQRFRWIDQLLSHLELQTRIAIFTPVAKAPADLRFNSRTKYPVFDAASMLAPESLDRVLEVQ